ncbi:MAG TPA: SDR family NAD(P)-dependent oxidoreductase [Arsenicitalea sp.]|nr:SDR family NAD(P)-dependent oxidoreductase [Arsenicitalea sp.]
MPKVAWIIGGGSGIGAAVAKMLAAEGWTVAISSRRPERLAEVAAGRQGVHPYPLDVTDEAAVAATVAAIADAFGRIDLALFGAVATQPTRIGEYDLAKYRAAFETNVLAFVGVAQHLIPQLEKQGGGRLAAIASLAGYFGVPRSGAYGASKAALRILLETMRTELAPTRIIVQMVAPGFVKSELTDRNKYPMPWLMETDAAARRIVDGLTRSDRFEIAFPWQMVWLVKIMRWLPYPLFFWLAAKLMPKAS